jgi:hypothetical protein
MEITLARLQKLIEQKAPIVGIPRPAEKPFAVERARLAGSIQGLEACKISLNTHMEIQGQARHYKLYSLDMRQWATPYKMLRAWAARQRAKRKAPKVPATERRKSELSRKIATAERKARQLAVNLPYNPVLEMGETGSDYERQQWAAWVFQKPMRRKIGKLATAHGLVHGYIPDAVIRQPRKLYEALCPLTGRNVTKYGDLRTTSRSEKPIEAEYLKHLYMYAGGAFQPKPYRRQEWRTPEHIREERLNYCQRMRDWRNAQETVNWLRAQLASFENCQEDGNDVY